MPDLLKLLVGCVILFALQLLFIRKMLGISRVIRALEGIDTSLRKLPAVVDYDRQRKRSA